MTLNSSVYSNLTYYFQSYEPGTTNIVDEPLFIPEYGLNVELIGPVVYRIFHDAHGKPKLKHIIEPTFSFRYESPIDDPDRIIDYLRYYRYHQISYGLTNRVLVKTARMPREVFAFGLRQTLYLSPEDSPLSIYQVDGEIPETSDISGYLRFYPASKYSLDVSGAYNPHFKTFSHLRAGARYGSRNDNAFLWINWYKSINPYYEGVIWNRNQIGLNGGIKMPRLSLDAEAELDYNIEEKQLLYTGLALVYHYQCLDFRAELRVFYFRERPDTQFNISISFGNIGKSVGFFSGLGF
jgi:LPS-assembly protein